MADSVLVDPLGRTIELSDATWFGHIIKGHPEMAGRRVNVEAAILSPREIRHSTSDENCRLFDGSPVMMGLMICVVAEVVGGYVKTAYLSKRIKQGVIEWQPPNPSKEAPGSSGSITT